MPKKWYFAHLRAIVDVSGIDLICVPGPLLWSPSVTRSIREIWGKLELLASVLARTCTPKNGHFTFFGGSTQKMPTNGILRTREHFWMCPEPIFSAY